MEVREHSGAHGRPANGARTASANSGQCAASSLRLPVQLGRQAPVAERCDRRLVAANRLPLAERRSQIASEHTTAELEEGCAKIDTSLERHILEAVQEQALDPSSVLAGREESEHQLQAFGLADELCE